MRIPFLQHVPDQTRNLNPTAEAIVAMIIWGEEYSEQSGGSMDFWDGLSNDRKKKCELVAKAVQKHFNPTTGEEDGDK